MRLNSDKTFPTNVVRMSWGDCRSLLAVLQLGRRVVRNYVIMTHVTGAYITSSQTARWHFLGTRADTTAIHSFTMTPKGKKGKAKGTATPAPMEEVEQVCRKYQFSVIPSENYR